MRAEISCAVLLCLMGCMTGAAASENIAGSIESDPIDFPQYAPVMIAQASQVQQVASSSDRTIGICQMISNPPTPSKSNQNYIEPVAVTRGYFRAYEHQVLNEGAAGVTVLAPTAHGTLEDLGTLAYDQHGNVTRDTAERKYRYRAEAGYVGQDSATFLVEKDGYKVKVILYMHVFGYAIEDDIPLAKELCPNGAFMWKISFVSDAGTVALSNSIQSWLSATDSFSMLSAASGVTLRINGVRINGVRLD